MQSRREVYIKNVVLVFDWFDVVNSIKQQERIRRGVTTAASASHVIVPTRNVPHYRNFLNNSGNKVALVACISQYSVEAASDILVGDQNRTSWWIYRNSESCSC